MPAGRTAAHDVFLGIDIGQQRLRLAKLGLSADGTWKVLDLREMSFHPALHQDRIGFADFLRRFIAQVRLPGADIPVWSVLNAPAVEVRHFTVSAASRDRLHATVANEFRKKTGFDEPRSRFGFEATASPPTADGDHRYKITAFAVSAAEATAAEDLFDTSGFPLTGLLSSSFALRQVLRAGLVRPSAENFCLLSIGDAETRVDVFSGADLLFCRVIAVGVDDLVDGFISQTNMEMATDAAGGGKAVVDLGLSEARKGSTWAFSLRTKPMDRHEAREVLGGLFAKPAMKGRAGILRRLRPALLRLIEQVQESLQEFSTSQEGRRVSQVYLVGPAAGGALLAEELGAGLGMPCQIFDPLFSLEADVALPIDAASRSCFAPALGLALSGSESSPNFLQMGSHEDKKESVLDRPPVFSALLLLMVFCLSASFWQSNAISRRQMTLAELDQRLAAFIPPDGNSIENARTRALRSLENLTGHGLRLQSNAVLEELLRLVPDGIFLEKVSAEFGPPAPGTLFARAATVRVAGTVSGDEGKGRSLLEEFANQLEKETRFTRADIVAAPFQRRAVGAGGVLAFELQLDEEQ